jgi:hypothetical protein
LPRETARFSYYLPFAPFLQQPEGRLASENGNFGGRGRKISRRVKRVRPIFARILP